MRLQPHEHVHFIGVGGAGMSGIARIMLARGITVSGSDAKDSRALDGLRALGATVFVGHHADQILGADIVVVSTAIRDSNPELAATRERGLRVARRAEALAAVMADRRGVVVIGTHGKTTTTSMLTVALQQCGLDPSFAIGGDLNESGANAHNGTGELFVAEADESDGSFLLLRPHGAIVTNVEPDHLDYYGTVAAYHEAFADFVECVDPDGFLAVCADDEGSAALADYARTTGRRVQTYGRAADADVRIADLTLEGTGSTFVPMVRGVRGDQIRLQVPGVHNATNAAGALTAGILLGQSANQLRVGLEAFTGTRRRFDLKGSAHGVTVYDDYAHHPTEIRATLIAARRVAGDGRLIVTFQPHRYTRTAAFVREFGEALTLADHVLVMEVYAAGEDPVPGASGAAVAAAVEAAGGRVVFEPSWSAVAGRLAELVRPGDLLMTLGAGDVTMIGPELLARLREQVA
jgi:UDP-N-acetylmuramate--alanine ligase